MKKLIWPLIVVALVFWSYQLGSSRVNRSLFAKRPTEDLDVTLSPVTIDARIPQESWVRSYDVYVSRIPWSNADSNYLPLHFVPRDSRRSRLVADYLDLYGVWKDTIKPFCPSQKDIDSGRPFVVYLDFISSDLTGVAPIEHAEIRKKE